MIVFCSDINKQRVKIKEKIKKWSFFMLEVWKFGCKYIVGFEYGSYIHFCDLVTFEGYFPVDQVPKIELKLKIPIHLSFVRLHTWKLTWNFAFEFEGRSFLFIFVIWSLLRVLLCTTSTQNWAKSSKFPYHALFWH